MNLRDLRAAAATAPTVDAPANLVVGTKVQLPDGRTVALCRPIMAQTDGTHLWMAQAGKAFVWVKVRGR